MTPEEYRKSLEFLIQEVFPVMGCMGLHSTVSVQYVGGEILLYPPSELRECVEIARELLGEVFGTVLDGVQSNLIGSERRIMELDLLFKGRIGTSVDGRGSQRTVKGNPDLYRKMVDRSRDALKRRRRRNPGSVFVMDGPGLDHVMYELRTAEEKGYDLYIRPVFDGGKAVTSPPIGRLSQVLCEAFDAWVMNSTTLVEPFTYMLSRRMAFEFDNKPSMTACPFIRNCAGTSINLDPDGSLYTCFEMADSRQMTFGNAVEGVFDREAWDHLDARRFKIDPRCQVCPFFNACQGGCMSEALRHTGSLYGRTDLCSVWTALFQRMDESIKRHGVPAVKEWLASL